MWAALLSIAATLAIPEAEKIIDGFKIGKYGKSDLEALASKILTRASEVGGTALNKATRALNSISDLSGSALVQEKIREMRKKAEARLDKVERAVSQANEDASNAASIINSAANKSQLFNVMDWGKSKDHVVDKAVSKVESSLNNVEKTLKGE